VEWWTRWPLANIGILLRPSRLIVIDADSEEAIREAETLGLPRGPRSGTGHGGHFYCRASGGMQGRVVKRGTSRKIDVLADGFVVAPPSRHRTGKLYRWVEFPDQKIRHAPAWALKMLSADVAHTRSEPIHLPDNLEQINISGLSVSPRIKDLIRTGEDPENPERYLSRSEAEFAAIHALIEAHCTDAQIAGVLLDPANGISQKPLEKGKKWLEDEIVRARAKCSAVEVINLCPWKCSLELLTEDPPEINWLMDKLVPAQSVVLITGREGTLKTWLALDWANRFGEGKDWHGYLCQSVSVLYMDAEMPFAIFHSRLYAVGGSQNLNIWRWQDDRFPNSLDDPLLLQASKTHGVIIIDTLKRFMGKLDENSSTDMAVITGQLRNLTRKGATVIALHHAAKDPNNPGYRGSTEIGAGVDVILNIEKKEIDGKTRLEFKLQKTRYAEDPRLILQVERTPARPIFTPLSWLPEKEDRATHIQMAELQTIIANLSKSQGCSPSQTQVITVAKEAGLGSRNTILKWLTQGDSSHWTSHPDGRSRVYELLSTCPAVQSLGPENGLDTRRPVQSIQGDIGVRQLDLLAKRSVRGTPTLTKGKRPAHVG